MLRSLVGSEMCIRDRTNSVPSAVSSSSSSSTTSTCPCGYRTNHPSSHRWSFSDSGWTMGAGESPYPFLGFTTHIAFARVCLWREPEEALLSGARSVKSKYRRYRAVGCLYFHSRTIRRSVVVDTMRPQVTRVSRDGTTCLQRSYKMAPFQSLARSLQ